MKRASYSMAVLAAAAAGTAQADHLPGTLNFENVTGARVMAVEAEAVSNEKEVEFGDFDNDNDLDVVIAVAHSDFGQRKNKLYRNDGGVFNEISSAVPLFTSGDVARNAFFRDYDQDGWLDIIVVCDSNTAGDGGRTKIWINRNDGKDHYGWLEQGNARLGDNTGGAACGGVSINADGVDSFDLYVGNYPGPSQDTMYTNDGNGFFTEVTGTHLPSDGDYTVDVAAGDMNGDGKMDLLISNWASNYIYYNDNNGAGTAVGDYSYSGSTQIVGNAGANENSMEPGDFDGDGDLDIYWANFSGGTGDRILRNNGNDGSNKATFTTLSNLPASVTSSVSRKATVADLNADGRDDILVMNGNNRPTILRNTTVNGNISFIDWTPGDTFPNGLVHRGWHSAVFDSNGDGDLDIFLGGWTGDHLFEQVASNEVDEDDLIAGALPDPYNLDPVAVLGSGVQAEVDTYEVFIGGTAITSIVLNGPDDYKLELLTSTDTLLATSDRGGLGIEEVIQYATGLGTFKVRVTVQQSVGSTDINGDGSVNVLDLIDLLLCFGNPSVPGCAAEDVNGDGTVTVLDLIDLLLQFGSSVLAENEYVLEVLSRSS